MRGAAAAAAHVGIARFSNRPVTVLIRNKSTERQSRSIDLLRLVRPVLLIACVGLLSCAADMTRSLRKYDTATFNGAQIELKALATQVFSLWNLHFANYTSYLSGTRDSSELPIERTRITSEHVAIHLEVLSTERATGELALQTAEHLNRLRAALNELFPFQIGKLRLHVVVVPDGYRYRKTRTVIFSGSNMSVAFAMRAKVADGNEVESSTREAIGGFAHEITHALFATHGLSQQRGLGKRVEEDAAYLVENCVELRVMGSISKDPHNADNKALRAGGLDGPQYFMKSLDASIDINETLAQLYAKGAPTIAIDDSRALELLALCRESIKRVVGQ